MDVDMSGMHVSAVPFKNYKEKSSAHGSQPSSMIIDIHVKISSIKKNHKHRPDDLDREQT